jgi:hypothetical protein
LEALWLFRLNHLAKIPNPKVVYEPEVSGHSEGDHGVVENRKQLHQAAASASLIQQRKYRRENQHNLRP